MDDIVLCNKRNEVPRCFKHNTGWQARVQELLNKMRDKHIKPIYMQRFNKLLCTCENLEYANLWEDISDEELKRSVHFLQNYIDNNTSGELVELCSSIMSRLIRDGELYNIVDNVTAPTNYKRSSAAKLCYLLQKIVEKDFSMMEPKKPSGVPAVRQKEEKSLIVELDEITPGFVKHLIGDRGKNILNFMRQERCKVEIKSDEGTGKVQAAVTKSVYPQDMAKLEAIGKKLQKFAIDTKEEHESYENTFGKPNSPTESYPASALGIDPSSSTGAYGDQEADGTSTIVKTEHSVTSSTPSTRISSNTSTSTTVGSTQTAGQSVSPSQASTRTMPETNTYNHIIDSTKTDSNADPCPTSCIVHDRRWLSTYQYTLNQCYNHFGLSRNYGSKFSRNVCTCRSDRPEARHYFITEDDMVKEFENCRKILQNWPKECQLIIQPLINQLIKYDKSDIWHSLFKFVYYIHGISGGASDCLRADHKLPGLRQANLVPRPEKPYLYQVNFAPQDSKASLSSGASVTMATGTNSIGPSLGFASLLSTAGSSVTNSTRDHGSQACCSMHAKMNELKEIPVATPKKKLKRVHKEDWSDDCYFHAKKKRSAFQCVVNTLLDNSRLPTYLSKPFCFNVCICNETVDMKDFYKTKTELQDDCRAMLTKLKMKRGPSQSTIKPFINDLEKYLNEDTMTDGLMKFVFYYMKASYGNWTPFEETYESMKGGN